MSQLLLPDSISNRKYNCGNAKNLGWRLLANFPFMTTEPSERQEIVTNAKSYKFAEPAGIESQHKVFFQVMLKT
eukprot:2933384-Amphidinium_carterae.1